MVQIIDDQIHIFNKKIILIPKSITTIHWIQKFQFIELFTHVNIISTKKIITYSSI